MREVDQQGEEEEISSLQQSQASHTLQHLETVIAKQKNKRMCTWWGFSLTYEPIMGRHSRSICFDHQPPFRDSLLSPAYAGHTSVSSCPSCLLPSECLLSPETCQSLISSRKPSHPSPYGWTTPPSMPFLSLSGTTSTVPSVCETAFVSHNEQQLLRRDGVINVFFRSMEFLVSDQFANESLSQLMNAC